MKLRSPLAAAGRVLSPSVFHVKHDTPASGRGVEGHLDVSRETFAGRAARRRSVFHVKHRRLLLVGLLAVALVGVGCGRVQKPDGWAAPVEVDGRLLVQAKTGQLSLVDPANGQSAWQYPTEDFDDRPFYATPVIDGDFAYLVDYKGRVTRLDISGAQPAVSYVTDLDAQVVATPLLLGGSLFVPSEKGSIAILDAESGAVKDTVHTADRRIWGAPAGDAGAVYVADLDQGVTVAFDASSGERLWEQTTAGASAADLALDGDLLLVGSFDRNLHALDVTQGGEEAWSFQGDGWFVARPLVDGDTVYVASMRGTIYAVDLATGQERWSFTAPDDAEFRSAPVVVDGALIVAARDGRIFARDAATGEERWSVAAVEATDLNADPLVDGQDIYYVTSKHELVRVDAGNQGDFQAVPLTAAQ